jgi:acyl-CoA reductase-like NAD-dependent aldehyde dehydrogenase
MILPLTFTSNSSKLSFDIYPVIMLLYFHDDEEEIAMAFAACNLPVTGCFIHKETARPFEFANALDVFQVFMNGKVPIPFHNRCMSALKVMKPDLHEC